MQKSLAYAIALHALVGSHIAHAVEAEASGRFAVHANHTEYSDEDFNQEVESSNWRMFVQNANKQAKEGVMQERERSVEASVKMDSSMDVYISNDWSIQEDKDIQADRQLQKIAFLTRAAEDKAMEKKISQAQQVAKRATEAIPDARVTLSKALPKQDRVLRAQAPAWDD
mmetsp:Transcript_68202/g.127305  ORF Transcript_68202/g.127305 Transcript_68202/m.127305 type:complete len:170 (-) Transcript_68202:57-566(-)